MSSVMNNYTNEDVMPASSVDGLAENNPPKLRPYDAVKLLADLLIAFFLFVVSVPVILIAAILVRLTSPGPATYSQVRLGRGGRAFFIYKLRTMYHNCEAQSGPQWCVKGDPRVTPIGRILRKTHIDELPQLWNVLRGDMSLVGPRPERPEIVDFLETAIAGYRGRLSVKPGVTGLAQIQLPSDTDLESVRKKLVLDLCYVERYGASLDLRLLFGTALYLMGVSYTGIGKAMYLPTGQPEAVLQPLPLKG